MNFFFVLFYSHSRTFHMIGFCHLLGIPHLLELFLNNILCWIHEKRVQKNWAFALHLGCFFYLLIWLLPSYCDTTVGKKNSFPTKLVLSLSLTQLEVNYFICWLHLARITIFFSRDFVMRLCVVLLLPQNLPHLCELYVNLTFLCGWWHLFGAKADKCGDSL